MQKQERPELNLYWISPKLDRFYRIHRCFELFNFASMPYNNPDIVFGGAKIFFAIKIPNVYTDVVAVKDCPCGQPVKQGIINSIMWKGFS
jgi:hypothetical protein